MENRVWVKLALAFVLAVVAIVFGFGAWSVAHSKTCTEGLYFVPICHVHGWDSSAVMGGVLAAMFGAVAGALGLSGFAQLTGKTGMQILREYRDASREYRYNRVADAAQSHPTARQGPVEPRKGTWVATGTGAPPGSPAGVGNGSADAL